MRDGSKAAASITPALTESYGFALVMADRLILLENLNTAAAANYVQTCAALFAV